MGSIRALAYAILDGALIPIDRVADQKPYYPRETRRHGVNVQVIADPAGRLVWASAALPGATNDLTAARTHGIVVGRVEGLLTGGVDRASGGEVDRGRGVPADPGMTVDVVVLGEEPVAERPRGR
jgi:hypothetical protein